MAGYRGLAKEVVTIRLGAGIDEANDPFLVDSPSVLGATNVRFDDRGTLGKRSGHEQLTVAGKPSEGLGEPNSIHEHEGSLAAWYPDGAYILDELQDTWRRTNEASPRPSRALTDPVARGNHTFRRPDVAIIGNLACVTWEDQTDSTAKAAFVDFSEGKLQILAVRTLDTIVSQPRVFAMSSSTRFNIVGAASGGTAYVTSYLVSAGTYTFSAAVSLTVSVGALSTSVWDAATDGGTHGTIAYGTSATDCAFQQWTYNGPASGVSKSQANFQPYALMYNTVLGTIVAVGRSLTAWSYIVYFADDYSGSVTMSALHTPTTGLDLPTTTPLPRATICQATAAGRMFAAFSNNGIALVASSTTTRNGTDIVLIDTGYAAVSTGHVKTMCLAAKAAYLSAVGDCVVPLCEQNGVSTTVGGHSTKPAPYGVLARPMTAADASYTVAVCGRFLADKIDKSQCETHLSSSVVTGDDLWLVAPVVTQLRVAISADFARRQIDLVRATLLDAPPVRSVTAQGLTVMAGGAGACILDGQHCAEMTPPVMTAVTTSGTDTGVTWGIANVPESTDGGTPATYPIKLVHRWVDARGNIHRGAPSDTFDLDLSSIVNASSNPPRMFLTPASPTAINGDRLTLVEVEVYQADAATADDFRLIAIVTPTTAADFPGLHYIAPRGAAASSAHTYQLRAYTELSAFPALYSQAEAEAIPAPPLLDVCSTQSRVWGLSAERRLDVFYTKPLVTGYAPEFYTGSTPVPAEGGEAIGLAALDDKVVVFKERRVFVLFGNPGDANGDGSTLQSPRLISGDVGCTNVNSIVEGPFGVAFLSERGFYSLDRGLSFSFIGESVKGLLGSATVTSGVLVPSQSEVRWTFGTSGEALVWNYRVNAWSYWTSFDAKHATTWRGDHTRLLTTGYTYRETPDAWADGASEQIIITTAWLKLTGLQRYSRIRRAIFLGRHFTGGLRIEAAFDYSPVWTDSSEWLESSLETLRASDGRVQVEVNPSLQKCESIRFRLTGLTSYEPLPPAQSESQPGRAFELVGIDLELGLRRGTFKSIAVDAKR